MQLLTPAAPLPLTHYALRLTARLLTSAATLLGLLAAPAFSQHSTNAAAEAKLKQLQVAPGLKVELVAAEPLLQNPVAFSVDERGRFFIAETHRWKSAVFDITQRVPWLLDDLSCRTVADREAHLHRLFPGTNFATLTNASELIRLVEDTDGDGRADKSTVLADGFNAPTAGPAAGILARRNELWFTSIPGLYHLTNRSSLKSPSATNHYSLITSHSHFGVHISVSGHDLHGLVFGPDGRLYFSLGDRGFELRPGMKHPGFSAEYLRRIAPDTGAVFRCQPDGSELEVFCIGLRNPQGLAFDALGNLFTVDNDTAGPDKARLLHLVEGGDYGWRISYQHMKNFGPWVTEELWRGGAGDILPWSGEVAQGPAGLAFYPGTGLPDRYANHFFICDFPGGIWSFSLKPRGASFELAAREKFLWNLLPTHAAFGPDGALYVSDWVEGWGQPEKGRLYRVSDPAQAGNAKQAEVKRLLREGMRGCADAELLLHLGHADERMRREAQTEFGRRLIRASPPEEAAITKRNVAVNFPLYWKLWKLLRDESATPLSRVSAVLSLKLIPAGTRIQQGDIIHGFDFKSETFGLEFDKSSELQVLAASLASDSSDRFRLLLGLTNSSASVQLHFALGAARVGGGASESGLVNDFIRRNADTDPYLTHAGMMALLGIDDFDAIQRATRDESPAVRRAALVCMQRLLRPEIAQFLRDPDPRLVLEAARAINDAGIEPAYPALAALLPVATNVGSWLTSPPPAATSDPRSHERGHAESILRRALNAHYRLGHATNAQALAEFAAGTDALRSGAAVPAAASRSGVPPEPATGTVAKTPAAVGTTAPLPPALDDSLRAEALFLLSAWEIQPATPGNVPVKIARVDGHGSTPLVNPENWPGWFDRVCGLWRPLPPRNADAARDALRPHLASLLASGAAVPAATSRSGVPPGPANGTVAKTPAAVGTTAPLAQLAAIAAVEKLALTEAAPQLAALVQAASQPTPVRLASLRTLAHSAFRTPHSALLSASVTLALADTDPSVRREAVKLAAVANPTTAVPLLERLLATEQDTRLGQAALTALGDLPGPAADAVLAQQLTLLTACKLAPELHLDLLEAAAKRPAALASTLQRFTSSLPPADPLAPFRTALVGGDAVEGKRLFYEHPGAQCIRCHGVRGEGGIVGPGLSSVGNRLTREQLLESIVFPNKVIAVGFENATIVLKSGANHSGLVKSETATELVLDSPEDGKLTLKKTDIEKRIRGLSAMPEGVDKLVTRRELRDLVEYLAGLK